MGRARKLHSAIFMVGLGAMLTSCTEEIPFELNNQEFARVIVDAEVTTEMKHHEVKLSRTISFYDNTVPPPISGASVEVSSNGTSYLFEETELKGVYLSKDPFAAEIGKDYELRVEVEGEVYESTSGIIKAPRIDSLGYEKLKGVPPGRPTGDEEIDDNYFVLSIWFQEPQEVNQYYMLRTFKNGVLQTDTATELIFFDDLIYNGEYLDDIKFDVVEAQIGDTIDVELWTISEEYYLGMASLFSETVYRGGLFDPPPSNVESNLSNGALGFFFTGDRDRKSVILTEEDKE